MDFYPILSKDLLFCVFEPLMSTPRTVLARVEMAFEQDMIVIHGDLLTVSFDDVV